MRRVTVVLCMAALVGLAVWAQARTTVVMVGQGAVAGGKTYLLQETFETADGTNLSGYNSWTGSNVDNLEVDTAQYQSGSASALRNGADTNLVTKALSSGVSSGKLTIDYYARVASYNYDTEFIIPSKSTYSWAGQNFFGMVGLASYYVVAWTGTSTVQICDASVCFAADTWHRIEVELDFDAGTYIVWINGIQGSACTTASPCSGTFDAANYEPLDSINLSDNTGSSNSWVDNINVYSGARQ